MVVVVVVKFMVVDGDHGGVLVVVVVVQLLSFRVGVVVVVNLMVSGHDRDAACGPAELLSCCGGGCTCSCQSILLLLLC